MYDKDITLISFYQIYFEKYFSSPIIPKHYWGFTINGKEFKNVRIRQSKVKNNIVIEKVTKVAPNTKKVVKRMYYEKETERASFNWWWLLLLLIPLIYFLYERKRN